MFAVRAYFDHAATSPMQADVLAAYTAELTRVGNPSALHADGQAARMRLEAAREELAELAGAGSPSEVLFTSGGTEADNIAVQGLWRARNAQAARPRLLVSAVEHPAVLETAEALAARGAELAILPVDSAGVLDLAALEAELADSAERTALISVMAANNEVGALQPIARAAELARAHGVPLHIDAVQAFGQVPLDFSALGAAAMSITAHKLGGPVGVGALLLARDAEVAPVQFGGGQERAVRSGTLDVAGAVAFAAAARAACADRPQRTAALAALRDRLIAGIEAAVPQARLSGPAGPGRLPGSVHMVFPGCEADSLLFGFDAAGFDTSAGSACAAGVNRPSSVLLAMGMSETDARSAQRFTLGPTTTGAEVDALIAAVPGVVAQARAAGMVSAEPAWRAASAERPATPTGAVGR